MKISIAIYLPAAVFPDVLSESAFAILPCSQIVVLSHLFIRMLSASWRLCSSLNVRQQRIGSMQINTSKENG